VFGNDHFFIGQAVRHQLTKRWALIAEANATLPLNRKGGATNVRFNSGVQESEPADKSTGTSTRSKSATAVDASAAPTRGGL